MLTSDECLRDNALPSKTGLISFSVLNRRMRNPALRLKGPTCFIRFRRISIVKEEKKKKTKQKGPIFQIGYKRISVALGSVIAVCKCMINQLVLFSRCLQAYFSYNPKDDKVIPCKEAGLEFHKGDILHIVDMEDRNWWQAKKEGDPTNRAGDSNEITMVVLVTAYRYNLSIFN